MKLNLCEPDKARRILVYGAPKTGKTVLVGMLAEKYKLLWIDIENGAASLISNVPKQFQSNIELIKIPDTREFPIAIDTCLKLFTGAKGTICNKHGKWNCPLVPCKEPAASTPVHLAELGEDWVVVLDSATQLTNSTMSHICKGKTDDYKPDWEDYRKQGAVLDRVFSQMQQAAYNIVVISHETMTEMQDGKMKIVPVAGSSNFSKTFAKYFDDVVYCEMVNKKHKFASSTNYGVNIITGSRSNHAIEKDEVPKLLSLFNN